MNKISYDRKFTAGAAFGSAVLFSMLSFGNSAEAASVFSCKGPTAEKVVACCEQITKENGLPHWMIQSRINCRSAVVCWRKFQRCGIQYKFAEREFDDVGSGQKMR